MKRLLVCTCLILGLAFAAAAVQAAPIPAEDRDPGVVYNWDYSVSGIFTEWTSKVYDRTTTRTGSVDDNTNTGISYGYTMNVDANNNASRGDRLAARESAARTTLDYNYVNGAFRDDSATGYTSLRWGSGSDYSSVGIQAITGQTVATDNPDLHAANGVTLWHDNQTLTFRSGITQLLHSGTVLLTLNLIPDISGPEWLDVDQEVLDALTYMANTTFATELKFYFLETLNGEGHDNDIFILEDPFSATKEVVTVGGVTYTFTFGASFNPINDEYMSIARGLIGTNKTLYGWVTDENDFTAIPTYLSVHYKTDPPPHVTPEPGTVALMGLGLLGLFAAARRCKK